MTAVFLAGLWSAVGFLVDVSWLAQSLLGLERVLIICLRPRNLLRRSAFVFLFDITPDRVDVLGAPHLSVLNRFRHGPSDARPCLRPNVVRGLAREAFPRRPRSLRRAKPGAGRGRPVHRRQPRRYVPWSSSERSPFGSSSGSGPSYSSSTGTSSSGSRPSSVSMVSSSGVRASDMEAPFPMSKAPKPPRQDMYRAAREARASTRPSAERSSFGACSRGALALVEVKS